jgi:hypothetical protein
MEFENITQSYPNTSSYICFTRFIQGKGYNRAKINRLLKRMVEPTDYLKSELGQLLDYLVDYGKTTNTKRKK